MVVAVGAFQGAAYGLSIRQTPLEAFLGYVFGIGLSQIAIILICFSLFHKSRRIKIKCLMLGGEISGGGVVYLSEVLEVFWFL